MGLALMVLSSVGGAQATKDLEGHCKEQRVLRSQWAEVVTGVGGDCVRWRVKRLLGKMAFEQRCERQKHTSSEKWGRSIAVRGKAVQRPWGEVYRQASLPE